ncbi:MULTISPECIES: hypothetical protein [Enterobacterales]|jgi:hypothetical protein|uniref:hypothetical protein n=1 Tax=Enterobacterales TaxID=91347 RepID=UPI0003BFA326|nr:MULTISPECIES: hypothetical protein [Enterobacteriaceae]EFA0779475.1 hypothetical protein [Escherichia coli]EFF9667475.1 hypothetical protein [Escherichia coli]EKJ3356006.1 hypothetical protein [Escherichia coli]ELS5398328.1 hypothetical protein [Escherichia coli]ESN47271.1 hypothetical protein L363_05112 [Klebsiella pneumoniae MGH 17]
MNLKIDLPPLADQRRVVYESQIKNACEALRANLDAPVYSVPAGTDAGAYNCAHLKTESEGWMPPEPEIVDAWFRQFQNAIPDYNTDEKLGALLGITRTHSVRDWRKGTKPVPYGIWRRFLIMTGRVVQEITPVLGFFE